MYKSIEEITVNTWPAQYSALLNGWMLRYAGGYTKRSNSVSPLYLSDDCDIIQNINEAELFYRNAGLPAVFKITPYVIPSDLEELLVERGYDKVDLSSVRILDLKETEVPEPSAGLHARIMGKLDEEWLDDLMLFNGLTPAGREMSSRILTLSPLKQAFVTLFYEGRAVAAGLGVIQNSFVGLYDIVTNPSYRKQGFGEQLVLHILEWAKQHGAGQSFLQVVQQNEAACRLYDKLGYKQVYEYWYRIKKK